jgi:hypothetical protein
LETQRPRDVGGNQLAARCALLWRAAIVAHKHTQAPGGWQVARAHEQVCSHVCDRDVTAAAALGVLNSVPTQGGERRESIASSPSTARLPVWWQIVSC